MMQIISLTYYYSSRYLINALSRLCFSVSYQEVQIYKRNAAMLRDICNIKVNKNKNFVFVAGNVDHLVGPTLFINPFVPNASFLYPPPPPLKTSVNLTVF